MTEFLKLGRKPKITNKSDKFFVKLIICWLCNKEFRNVVNKVETYCKLSGKYLGGAHPSCIDYVNRSD